MSVARFPETDTSTGLVGVVAGIIAFLPNKRISASSGAWHWAFMQLRDKHSSDVPELCELEFAKRSAVWPISERLERILQIIDIAGGSSTLNPNLVVRQFDKSQKAKLKSRLTPRLKNRKNLMAELGRELQQFLNNAPPNPV